jgi:sugar phosphate isomerase/epimerase
MFDARVTRRELIKTAGAAVPIVGASLTLGNQGANPATGATIGISTLEFRKHTNAQLAEELAAAGIRMIQLYLNQPDSRYWKYNGRSDLSDLTTARCEAIARAYGSAGIALHSMGVYTNLIHGDPAERQANLAYFENMMKAGGAMGIRMFITEAGHYEPEKPTTGAAYHFRQQVWGQMLATVKQLAEMAERHDATVLLEPSFASFLASAKRTRVFLQEVNSPRIRALLDPANILEVDDLEEMFEQLTPWIDCLHAKDRKLHVEQGVAAGQGDLDYRKFVSLALRRTPKAPLILEYVGPDNYQQALQHLQKALREETVSSPRSS